RWSDVLHERILQSLDDGVKTGIRDHPFELRKAIQVRAADRVDLGSCLFDRRTCLQPCDVPPDIIVMSGPVLRCQRQRCPQRDVRRDQSKRLRHDADDGVGLAIDPEVATDGAWISAELSLPECETEERLCLTARLGVAIGEHPADAWRPVGETEKRWRDAHRRHTGGPTVLIHTGVWTLEEALPLR